MKTLKIPRAHNRAMAILRWSVFSIAFLVFLGFVWGAFFSEPQFSLAIKLFRFALGMAVFVPVAGFVCFVIFNLTKPVANFAGENNFDDKLKFTCFENEEESSPGYRSYAGNFWYSSSLND